FPVPPRKEWIDTIFAKGDHPLSRRSETLPGEEAPLTPGLAKCWNLVFDVSPGGRERLCTGVHIGRWSLEQILPLPARPKRPGPPPRFFPSARRPRPARLRRGAPSR